MPYVQNITLTEENCSSVEQMLDTLFAALSFYLDRINTDPGFESFHDGADIWFDERDEGLGFGINSSEIYIPFGSEISYTPEVNNFLTEAEKYRPFNGNEPGTFWKMIDDFFIPSEKPLVTIRCEESSPYTILIGFWSIKVCFNK